MTSEEYADSAALMSMAHLEREDFSHLEHLGYCLLSAKDGKRDVMIYLDIALSAEPTSVIVPNHLAKMAQSTGARLDIMRFRNVGTGSIVVSHVMNVEGDKT